MSRWAQSKPGSSRWCWPLWPYPQPSRSDSPAIASADSCSDAATNIGLPLEVGPCADVLAQETRWLKAITAGDVPTVESILGPTFKHVNSEGRLLSRAEEIASTAAAAVHDEPVRAARRYRGRHRGDPRSQHPHSGRQGDRRRAIHRRVRLAERGMDGAVGTGNRHLTPRAATKFANAANLPRA